MYARLLRRDDSSTDRREDTRQLGADASSIATAASVVCGSHPAQMPARTSTTSSTPCTNSKDDDRHDRRSEATAPETLAEFKDSFFYGRRSDLNMKFLADLAPDDAGAFIAEMFTGIGGLIDDGDPAPLVERFVAWQRRAYGAHLDQKTRFAYDDGPFAAVTKPAEECRVVLVTSSGHYVEGDDPRPFGVADMSQAEAEVRIGELIRAAPTLSVIPTDTPPDRLRVRHGGYPVGAVAKDHRVALPIEHLAELARRGVIGELAARAYSFVGATSQLRLREQVAVEWAEMLRDEEIELALLVPV